MNIDLYDRELLKLFQKDTRLTAEAMGEQVGLSTPSVHRRLKRLRDAGVIASEVAVLDGKLLGVAMTFIVTVEVERERVDLLDNFKRWVNDHDMVQQCYYVTGENDFVLIVKSPSLEDFEVFTQEAFLNNSNVRKFNTAVVMSAVKTGLSLPLDEQ